MKRQWKMILCWLLSFALLLGCLAGCAPAQEAESQVSSARSVPAASIPQPPEEDFITRAEWIEQLVKTVGGADFNPTKAAELEPYFSDVAAEDERYGYIQTAAMMEWLDTDVTKGVFEPNAPATRGFVASTAVLAAGYMMVGGEDEPTDEMLQSGNPLALLFAKRLGVISPDESGSLQAQETVDDALCESVLAWYTSVNTWEEDLPDVTEFNPNVRDFTGTELAYTLDAENILRLPEDFAEAPAAGDIWLLPATAEWPDGAAVTIEGGDAEAGYQTQTPAIEDIFASLSLNMAHELDIAGPARLIDNGSTAGDTSEADAGADSASEDESSANAAAEDEASAGDAAETDTGTGDTSETSEADAGAGDTSGAGEGVNGFSGAGAFQQGPGGEIEGGIELRRDDEGRLWNDMYWNYRSSYPLAEGLTLDVNKIGLRISIRYGEPFKDASVPQWMKDIRYELEVRFQLDLDFALSLKLDGGSVKKTYEKDFLKDIMARVKNPIAKVNATMTLEAEASGEGKVGFPLTGRARYQFGGDALSRPSPVELDKINVRMEGALEASLTFKFDLGVSLFGLKVVSNTLTSKFKAAATYIQDNHGICMGIDATIETQYVMDLGSALVAKVLDAMLDGYKWLFDDSDDPLAPSVEESVIYQELVRLRNCLVSAFSVPVPEKPVVLPVGRLHWEGESMGSLRRTPNDVCTRDFTLELVSPSSVKVDESAALSVVARPNGASRVGLTGRVRAESRNTGVLSCSDNRVTGHSEGEAVVELVWVFRDEHGEWDSLLKGEGAIKVTEEDDSSSDSSQTEDSSSSSGGEDGGGGGGTEMPGMIHQHCIFCDGYYTIFFYPDGSVDRPRHGPFCLTRYPSGRTDFAGQFASPNGDGHTPYNLRWGEEGMAYFDEQITAAEGENGSTGYEVWLYRDGDQFVESLWTPIGTPAVDFSEHMTEPGDYQFAVFMPDDGLIAVSDPYTVK